VIDAADPEAVPLAGLIPIDVAALDGGARALFGRLAGLGEELPDRLAGPEGYAWLTAAAFLVGGLAYTAQVHRGKRRADRVTLGTDSVLARWGERHVGNTP
jgi:hypothetical protein